MKLYVAVVEDRHTDPDPQVFSTAEAAVEWARAEGIERGGWDDVEPDETDGFLFWARYSIENDCVWVVERTLDRP